MQFFTLLIFKHWLLAAFLGLGAVVVTCMAFGAKWHRSDREEVADPTLIREKSSHLRWK